MASTGLLYIVCALAIVALWVGPKLAEVVFLAWDAYRMERRRAKLADEYRQAMASVTHREAGRASVRQFPTGTSVPVGDRTGASLRGLSQVPARNPRVGNPQDAA